VSLNTASNGKMLKSFKKERDIISSVFWKSHFGSTVVNGEKNHYVWSHFGSTVVNGEKVTMCGEAFSRKLPLINISSLFINVL
jgi:hypothetical protein